MKLKMNIIDAFTDTAFQGNPAAIIMTDNWLPVHLMQSIATENNLSETAFLKKNNEENYEIRWFSPITEIDFCGHATLASAFVIFGQNNQLKTISFFAQAVGKLTVTQKNDGYIEMIFPNRKPEVITNIPSALLNGLSIPPARVLLNEQAYFVVYEKEEEVHAVIQNSEHLKQLAPYDVVVTSASAQYDFISRYFWPANGGDEDPVTGSIHTGLAPYWAEQLNKPELVAYQASKRGGKLICRVENNNVYISGQAVQYLVGEITVP